MKVSVKQLVESPKVMLEGISYKKIGDSMYHLFIDCRDRFLASYGGSYDGEKSVDFILLSDSIDSEEDWEIELPYGCHFFESPAKNQKHFIVITDHDVFCEMNINMESVDIGG